MDELTHDQRATIRHVLVAGGDRCTAALVAGAAPEAVGRAMRYDSEVRAEIERAEAGAEFSHMRNLQHAAANEKNWRASVWWLERRAPDRYAKRAADSVLRSELCSFVQEVAVAIDEEVSALDDGKRLMARLRGLAAKFDTGERSVQPMAAPPAEHDDEGQI